MELNDITVDRKHLYRKNSLTSFLDHWAPAGEAGHVVSVLDHLVTGDQGQEIEGQGHEKGEGHQTDSDAPDHVIGAGTVTVHLDIAIWSICASIDLHSGAC